MCKQTCLHMLYTEKTEEHETIQMISFVGQTFFGAGLNMARVLILKAIMTCVKKVLASVDLL